MFEAQLKHEEGDLLEADSLAFSGMLKAAKALIQEQIKDIGKEPDHVVHEFRTRFYDTELFFDQYARGKFGRYLLQRYEAGPVGGNTEAVHQLIEEAQLFIDATHACSAKMQEQGVLQN